MPKYLEDFRVGDRITLSEHRVTREEIVDYARRWDPQPFHLDEEEARVSVFGGIAASGSHVLAISVRLLGLQESRVQVLAALGWDEVRFVAPVKPGDVISVIHECVEVRPSRSRPDRGVVRNRITAVNDRGEVVLTYIDTIMVARRG